MTGPRASPWLRWGPLLLALALAVLFRLPPLVNAGALNSDAAVVGLQAMHLLRGEGADNLWGTGYQAILDPLLAAALFRVVGPGPLALLMVPLLGMLAMIGLCYDLLRRRLEGSGAFALVLPLALAGVAINLPMLYVMRQTMVTVMVLGLWLLDGAAESRRPKLRFATGAFFLAGGLYVDVFALVLLPAGGLFAALCCFDGPPSGGGARRPRLLACAAGLALGLVPAKLIHHLGTGGQGGPSLTQIGSNARLLWEHCLPFALGAQAWTPTSDGQIFPWEAPWAVGGLQLLGALGLVLGLAFGAAAVLMRSRLSWQVRRLGLLGAVAAVTTLAAFVFSKAPQDIWSVRYLAPLLWTAPFSLAPAAAVLGRRWAPLFVPGCIAPAALGGWLAYGPFVDGPFLRADPRASAEPERQLAATLRERGIRFGAADYWLAYRLTFLFGEDPTLVPVDPIQDRYPAYRVGYDEASRVAVVFHSGQQPWAVPDSYEQELRSNEQRFERLEVSGYTVFLVSR